MARRMKLAPNYNAQSKAPGGGGGRSNQEKKIESMRQCPQAARYEGKIWRDGDPWPSGKKTRWETIKKWLASSGGVDRVAGRGHAVQAALRRRKQEASPISMREVFSTRRRHV